MPNKRKRPSAPVRRSRKKVGAQRLMSLFNDATDACGTASSHCYRLEEENRSLLVALGHSHHDHDYDRQHQARRSATDSGLITSIFATIAQAENVCLAASGANDIVRPPVDCAPDTSPDPSDAFYHYSRGSSSPRPSDRGTSPGPPSSTIGSPSPCPPSNSPGDSPRRRPGPQAEWPGSPRSSPD